MSFAIKPEGCVGCPAHKYGLGFVPPSGPPAPEMVLVGQGPGQQEGWSSQPFFPLAPIGERLNKWLYRSGISRLKIGIGNIIQCWLPDHYKPGGIPDGNREPTGAEIRWCWNAHVGPWLHGVEPAIRVLVPVGVPATRFLLGIAKDKGAEKFMGSMVERDLPPLGENSA